MLEVSPTLRLWLLFPAVLLVVGAAPPQLVSPGSLLESVPVATTCPVFSWSPAPDADCQELMVMAANGPVESTGGSRQLLRKKLPGGASSWTPPGLVCFPAGRTYAWAVRSACGSDTSAWSEPLIFEIRESEREISVDEALRALEAHAARWESARPGAGSSVRENLPEPEPMAQVLSGRLEGSPEAGISRVAESAETVAQGSLVIEGDFAFSSPRFEYVRVSPSAFTLGDEAPDVVVRRSTAGFLWVEAGLMLPYEVYLSADIALPRSSTPQYFSCSLLDNSTADLSGYAALHRRRYDSVVREEIARVDLSTNGHEDTTVVNLGAHPHFSEETSEVYDYFIELYWNPGATGQSLRFYGCSVLYQTFLLVP